MNSLARIFVAGFLCLSLSACGWFGGEAEIEPADLVSFDEEKDVKTLWSRSVGSGAGDKFSQLTFGVSDDVIYVSDVDGQIVAVNRLDGKELWSADLGTTVIGGVGVGPQHVAVSTEQGEIIVLNSANGSELWRSQLSSEALSPAQMNNNLLVSQLVNGKLVALDLNTGERRWTYDSQIPRLTLRGTSAPIVAANITIAGFASGKLVAVRNDTGAEVWERLVAAPQGKTELERMVDIDARPLYVDGVIYIVSYQGRLVAINARDAQILWSQAASSYRGLASGFGNIYVSETTGFIQAFDQRSSASVWSQTALEYRQTTSPVVLGNTVVVGDFEGYLHFMSQIDGHFVGRYKVDSSGLRGDMRVIDDTLYVLSNGGRLAALQLD
ncbi:outer membrane protein assembly factor BamB [Amphritea sp. HPY]|uniref:outer membrane protein assembly factor BamB n=1 Tax=Amphritea sp. HPY TaxID=3421652 RepID=UPI003D7D30C1